MSEDRRSKGMYHSLIGKSSLRVGLVMGLLIGLCVLLLAACGGEEAAKGGADQEHNKSTSGDTASTNLQTDQEHKKSTSGGTAPKGAGQEHKKSTSGGTASSDGLIVFRRYVGRELTLDGRRHSKSAIFTMYPNGSHIRQITHPPEGFSDDSPAWSPDGTKVAFERATKGESTSRIMVLNTKTGDEHQVEGVEGSDPAFSPDGKRLAFEWIDGIWIVGLDGSYPHQVTYVQKRGASEFKDSGPAFSPDGKRLVFERVRVTPHDSAVFVQRLDSSITGSPEDARQITPWEMGCGDGPEFSPKGDWVLFSCTPEGGFSDLYMVHPNGTGWNQLTKSEQLT